MSSTLHFSITFLSAAFHGRDTAAQLEWPPAPLRLFQALVAASAARWPELEFETHAAAALRWLATLSAPVIVAPSVQRSVPLRIAVPNNDLDVVAAAWARGRDPAKEPAALKTMKSMASTLLLDGDVVHYLWQFTGNAGPETQRFVETLRAAARSMTHLGWGVDMVIGNAEAVESSKADVLADCSGNDTWRPVEGGYIELRVPGSGTLDALARRHQTFLNRVGADGFILVPPLPEGAYLRVQYSRDSDYIRRPFAAFELRHPVKDEFRPFEATRNATIIAAMVRHALARAAKIADWPEDRINTLVHGHTPDGTAPAQLGPGARRFAYLPLPSIERRRTHAASTAGHVGMIRRVIVAAGAGMVEDLAWARRVLAGAELFREGERSAAAVLSPLSGSEATVRRYTDPAATWTTVTPVVMPGFDDRRSAKTERLLRKGLLQAGMPSGLVQLAALDWRATGYLPGVDSATRYHRPRTATEAPCVHVHINWRNAEGKSVPVAGPIAAGSGRYRGLGVFVAF